MTCSKTPTTSRSEESEIEEDVRIAEQQIAAGEGVSHEDALSQVLEALRNPAATRRPGRD